MPDDSYKPIQKRAEYLFSSKEFYILAKNNPQYLLVTRMGVRNELRKPKKYLAHIPKHIKLGICGKVDPSLYETQKTLFEYIAFDSEEENKDDI